MTDATPANPAGTSTPKPTPQPKPKPGPRPGAGVARRPHPAPRPQGQPGAEGSPVVPVVPSIPSNNPAEFGKVDADGTVWVKDEASAAAVSGFRSVGAYQAGSPEEALAHYGARFDALMTEVVTLTHRLATRPSEAKRVAADASHLLAGLDEAAVVGDIADLRQRLTTLVADAECTHEKVEAAAKEATASAIERKKQLIAEAEDLAQNATHWKNARARLNAIVEEWRTLRRSSKKEDDALWHQFSAARDAFNTRSKEHFAALDQRRAVARSKKEKLIERAESLQNSTDWAATSAAYADLMREWKAAGPAPRSVDDALWERFRAARDVFFDARQADQDSRDAEFQANAEAKRALLKEYDSRVNPAADGVDTAKSILRELQENWEEIGYVPRDRVREFEQAIGEIEQRVADAEAEQWRRTDPETQARVAQFTAKVESFTQQAEAAEAKGNAKKAEQLRAQAAQWQEWADAAAAAVDN